MPSLRVACVLTFLFVFLSFVYSFPSHSRLRLTRRQSFGLPLASTTSTAESTFSSPSSSSTSSSASSSSSSSSLAHSSSSAPSSTTSSTVSSTTSSSSTTTTTSSSTSSSLSSSTSSSSRSSSSSSSPSSSSSSSSFTSSPTPSFIHVPLPSSTYYVTTFSSQPYVSSTGLASGAQSASRTGFLQNKGAVAGTFTVVGLAIAGAIAGLVLFLIKRHRNKLDRQEVDEYFDKMPALGQHHADLNRSTFEFTPPNTYNPRDAHHRLNNPFRDPPIRGGLDFPSEVSFSNSRPPSAAPGTAYAAAIAQEGPYQYTGRPVYGYDSGAIDVSYDNYDNSHLPPYT